MNSRHRGEHARKEFAKNGGDLLAGKAMAAVKHVTPGVVYTDVIFADGGKKTLEYKANFKPSAWYVPIVELMTYHIFS